MSNISMEARIELETRDLEPNEVRELILDNCRSATIVGLTNQYEELEVLSMINLGLTTLKGFPDYPKLRSLELSDNKLGGELEYLKGCPNIASIKICNNRIADIGALEPLKKLLPHLISLDLIECPIADSPTYREDVLAAIPQLIFLDGIDKEGNAEPESDEDYDGEGEDEEEDLGTDEDVDSEEEGDEDDELDEDEDDDDDDDEEGDEAVVGKEDEAKVGDEKQIIGEADDCQPAAKRLKFDAVEEVNPDSNHSNGVEEVNDSNS